MRTTQEFFPEYLNDNSINADENKDNNDLLDSLISGEIDQQVYDQMYQPHKEVIIEGTNEEFTAPNVENNDGVKKKKVTNVNLKDNILLDVNTKAYLQDDPAYLKYEFGKHYLYDKTGIKVKKKILTVANYKYYQRNSRQKELLPPLPSEVVIHLGKGIYRKCKVELSKNGKKHKILLPENKIDFCFQKYSVEYKNCKTGYKFSVLDKQKDDCIDDPRSKKRKISSEVSTANIETPTIATNDELHSLQKSKYSTRLRDNTLLDKDTKQYIQDDPNDLKYKNGQHFLYDQSGKKIEKSIISFKNYFRMFKVMPPTFPSQVVVHLGNSVYRRCNVSSSKNGRGYSIECPEYEQHIKVNDDADKERRYLKKYLMNNIMLDAKTGEYLTDAPDPNNIDIISNLDQRNKIISSGSNTKILMYRVNFSKVFNGSLPKIPSEVVIYLRNEKRYQKYSVRYSKIEGYSFEMINENKDTLISTPKNNTIQKNKKRSASLPVGDDVNDPLALVLSADDHQQQIISYPEPIFNQQYLTQNNYQLQYPTEMQSNYQYPTEMQNNYQLQHPTEMQSNYQPLIVNQPYSMPVQNTYQVPIVNQPYSMPVQNTYPVQMFNQSYPSYAPLPSDPTYSRRIGSQYYEKQQLSDIFAEMYREKPLTELSDDEALDDQTFANQDQFAEPPQYAAPASNYSNASSAYNPHGFFYHNQMSQPMGQNNVLNRQVNQQINQQQNNFLNPGSTTNRNNFS